MFRKFDLKNIPVYTKSIEEFSVGSHIEFYDECSGKYGSGIITSFARADYDPLIWYKDDDTGESRSVHLGWCTLSETEDKKMYEDYISIGNEQYKVAMKCRISGVDNALGYVGLDACVSYMKALFVAMVSTDSSKLLKGTRLLDMFTEILRVIPTIQIDKSMIQKVDYLLNGKRGILRNVDHVLIVDAMNMIKAAATQEG